MVFPSRGIMREIGEAPLFRNRFVSLHIPRTHPAGCNPARVMKNFVCNNSVYQYLDLKIEKVSVAEDIPSRFSLP